MLRRPLETARYRYDPAGQLISITREDRADRRRDEPRPARRQDERDRRAEFPELHLTYDVLGNRASFRLGDEVTRYRYDAASQLLASEGRGRHTEYRYDPAGRLTEEHEREREGEHRDDDLAGGRPGERGEEFLRRTISYNGFGQPVSVTRTVRGRSEHSQAVFNGDALLASLTLTSEDRDRDEQRAASVRYRWGTGQVPQILAQHAEPGLDDAERDQPGRLDAEFAYGYGRTFASWAHGAAVFHTDALGSAVRTEDTEPWVQARRYDTFGAPEGMPEDGPEPRERPEHPERPERERHEPPEHERPAPEAPELPRFGYRGELALGPMVYLRARTYDAQLGRFTTPDPLALQARQTAAVSTPTGLRDLHACLAVAGRSM